MNKVTHFERIFAAVLCLIMMLGIAAMPVSAAKENFKTCSYIGIRNCEAPVAGNHPDFDVTPYSPGQYEIMSINWFKDSVAAKNSLSSTSTFEYDTVYIVEFEVWAKDAYSFTTDSNGYTTVTADVGSGAASGEYDAEVYNVYGEDNAKYLTVRCIFPATENGLTPIKTVAVTDIVEPCAGDKPSYASTLTSVSTPYGDATLVQNIYWFDGTTQMTGNATFEEGKTYTVQLILIHRLGYEFAVNPNHVLASPGKPFTAVTATINGKTATVLPDYTRGTAASHIVVSAQFVCKPSRQITHVDITSVTEPKTGEEPKYFISCGDTTYERHSLSNVFYAYGVAWLDGKENFVTRNQDRFLPSTAYTISITLKPTGNHVFAADEYGRPLVTATVNGKEAEVHKSTIESGCIEVTYKFRKTDSLEVDKVEVSDIDLPKDGELPDFTMTLGDTTYAPFYSSSDDDEITKNSIMWFDRTTNKYMKVGVDKFVGGHTYSLFIFLKTTGNYTFKYLSDSDTYTATAKINGKAASVDACTENEIELSYDFTCEKPVHKCSPTKVDEVKATCTAAGKKAYYRCSECGKFFEDSKCTKEIANINAWGVIAKLEHTGGKATCSERAKCKNCGASYGELAAHNYGTAWDYKDEKGHAHKCKVCGAHDTVTAHSGGTAKCGEKAKCDVCKAEYGEPVQHKWGTKPEYTDNKGHAAKCIVCGEHNTVEEHTGGSADCKNKAKCSVCGMEYGKTGDHKWSADWGYTDRKGHAHKCTVCGHHDSVVKHTPGAAATETTSQNCTVCGYMIAPKTTHKHELVRTDKIEATCTGTGMEAYYYCESCDGIFSDSKGNKEIGDTDSLIIPAEGHKDSKWQSDADVHWKECSVKGCNTVTVEKEAHKLNKAGKCTICGYKEGAPDDTTVLPESDTTDLPESDTDDETADTLPTDSTDLADTADTENTTEPADTDNDNTSGGGAGIMIWVVIAAAAAVIAVAAVIVTVVVIAKRKKK